MPDLEDEAIIGQVLAGSRDAYRLLLERHGRAVYRLALRITANADDAEDVVQEAFLRAYRQLHRFRSQASFRTWISRIAANYALDLTRARKRFDNRTVERDGDEQNPADLAASTEIPVDQQIYGSEVRREIDRAMGDLSEQERCAFELRHHDGRSIEEISTLLGVSSAAAKHSIFRAVQKLRRALEPLVNSAS